MIPTAFVGAWRRVSIRLGNASPAEPCDVLWIQARAAFADLRVPRGAGGEPAAFAGHTTWEEPRLTWHHELDRATSPADVGHVTWDGPDLVERGTTVVGGAPTPYEEVWRRVGPSNELPLLVLARDDEEQGCDGMLVRVGNHALSMGVTLGGFGARSERHLDGTWHELASLGNTETLPQAVEPSRDWRAGQRIEVPGVGPWVVRESECA